MRRFFMLSLGLAVLRISAGAQAADPQQATTLSTASPADLQRMAEASCQTALDNEKFDYNSMDECVAATLAKLKRSQQQHASVAH